MLADPPCKWFLRKICILSGPGTCLHPSPKVARLALSGQPLRYSSPCPLHCSVPPGSRCYRTIARFAKYLTLTDLSFCQFHAVLSQPQTRESLCRVSADPRLSDILRKSTYFFWGAYCSESEFLTYITLTLPQARTQWRPVSAERFRFAHWQHLLSTVCSQLARHPATAVPRHLSPAVKCQPKM
jgi:hypothetical protein